MYGPAVATGSIPPPELIRPQLARILASPAFQAHPRASAFLRYVVEEVLAGRAGEIKQATIGCEVFGRPASYDPRQDAVVRSVARALREKLNGYYLAEGALDPIRIEIPKGCYVPSFRETAAPPAPRASRRRIAWPAAALATALLLYALGSTVKAVKAPDAAALYLVGRQKLLVGDIVAARSLLERAAALAPRSALIHASLANDLMALGYNALGLDEAFKAVANARGLSPTDALEVEGTIRAASGDYPAAAAAYGKLIEQRPERIDYRRALAQTQLAAGQPADCLRTTSQAHAVDSQLDIAEAYCRAGSGDFLGALEPVQRAEIVASERGERLNFARARLVEAGLLMSTNRTVESVAARNQARRICTALGDDLCAMRALRIQANTDIAEMRPAIALASYRAALPLARRMGSVKETAELLDGEGYALMQTDDFAGAKAAFLEALLTAQRGGQRAVGVHQDMIELALLEGEGGRAVTLAEQVERDAHSGGDRVTETAARIFKARALFLRRDFAGCGDLLQQVRPAIEKFHLSAGLPRLWRLTHANLNLALGRLDLAAGDLEARNDFGDISKDFDYQLARLRLLLGQAHYSAAARVAEETLAFLRGGGNQSASILVTALLSDAYGYAGQLAEARHAASAARSMLRDQTAPQSRITALASAARWAWPPLVAEELAPSRR